MVLLVIVLSAFTYSRNSIWKDSISLWEDVVKKPEQDLAHDVLGTTYAVQGKISDAVHQFKPQLNLIPVCQSCNLGVAYQNLGRDEAINEYKKQ
jgi:hypothetical protein